MLAALLGLLVTQAPPPTAGGPGALAPTAIETARLYFIAGDLVTAREWLQRGQKKEAKVCRPALKSLAEYAFLLGKSEELTLDEARQVVELDKRISPKEPGKLTRKVIDRFVVGPLKRAEAWAMQGAAGEAVRFVDDALKVDPANPEAKALRARLLDIADGGAPWDAGR
ncbi:MAG: hypothetical protein JNJ54_05420 [Myxococcaceae bacterium]|nr:hypothetical protein [Myxococcaceae bacterium]